MSDDVPPVVTEFYKSVEVVEETETTAKLKASCKKCGKSITCSWKPTKVTSNLIIHAKVNFRLHNVL